MNTSVQRLTAELDDYTMLVQHAATGELVEAMTEKITSADLRQTTKKAGWQFNWRSEARQPALEVYKLTLTSEPATIQGLVGLENRGDHTYMSLIESAPANLGKHKQLIGVPGGLVAFACKLAFERGQEGNLAFTSKTVLITHYEHTLGAFHAGGRLMIIEPNAAWRLIQRYFKAFQP